MALSLHRRPSLRKRRQSALYTSILTLVVILIVYYCHTWPVSSSNTPQTAAPAVPTSNNIQLLKQQARFWRSIYHIILNNDPQCQNPPDIVIPEKLDIHFEDDHVHSRPDILWIEDSDLKRMTLAHQKFLDDVSAAQIQLVYENRTRGVITTVSERQIPVLLIQLRMLRSSGSALPAEVFLSKPTAYTKRYCEGILKLMNATCVYFSDIFTAAGTGVAVATYQYKILSIFFSSFEEVLLLDSDAWPISSPDHLFTYPPFTETGLVLWPDFWYPSESPYFFSIAKIENPPMLHAKPATESGEIMYSKPKHEISILLAAYYNYFGPQYYYPLQSQGAPGQGDKETFGLAALARKESVYNVRTMVTAIGRKDSSGHFMGSAMIQYDPIVDFQQYGASTERHNEVSQDAATLKTTQKPLFVHANFPKFDPRTIFDLHNMADNIKTSPTRDTNGTYVRCWDMTAEEATERFGYDIERRFWEVIKQVACDDLVGEEDLSRNAAVTKTCQNVKAYIQHVFR